MGGDSGDRYCARAGVEPLENGVYVKRVLALGGLHSPFNGWVLVEDVVWVIRLIRRGFGVDQLLDAVDALG